MSFFQCSIGQDDDNSNSSDSDVYGNVWADFITSVTLYGALGAGCMVFFEVMRSKRNVFASRANCLPHRTPTIIDEKKSFGWIRALWIMTDEDILDVAGMDGYVFLRFLGFCNRISVYAMIAGCVVLMPVYLTSGGIVQSLFGKLTMDNIPQRSGILYISVASAYLLTIGVLFSVDVECKVFSRSREKFMISGDPDGISFPRVFLHLYSLFFLCGNFQFQEESK
jgi:hypothetical protein